MFGETPGTCPDGNDPFFDGVPICPGEVPPPQPDPLTQAATQSDVSTEAMKKRVQRGRQLLAECLAQDGVTS